MRISDFDPVSVGMFNKQIKNASLFVLVLIGVLILRLWFLQIVNGPAYRAKSEYNRIRLQDIPPFRGMILDRKGNVLVDNRPSYDLYVIPEEVQDQVQLLKDLNQLAGLDSGIAEQKLKGSSRSAPFMPVCLAKDMSRDMLGVIETHRFNLPGVIIKVEPLRHYVTGKLAFHLLGYLGEIDEKQIQSGQYPDNKQGDLIGRSGVEFKWQTPLNGTRGGEQVEVDAAGRKISTISMKRPLAGANICLTIDTDLQLSAEKALIGKMGAIVALDPRNGEVLAMASSPTVDPNLLIRGVDKTAWQEIALSKDTPLQNRALTGQYPPASVFKIIVALAGLEEGKINPEEIVGCGGVFFLGRHPFRCWRKQGHGGVNLHRALVESCDVYFYTMGKRLGIDRIARYAKEFGFGKMSGFDLGQEKSGLVPSKAWKLKKLGYPWQEGETISTSIGQSFLLVTPVQMATMIASVFNGGILYQPQVTKWIGKSETDKIYEFSPRISEKLNINKRHLEIVKNALTAVVNEPRGTGSKARMENITVAGKTGTAQVVSLSQDSGGIHNKDHAWFVAVAPAESPEIALAIVIEHGGHGGSAAAPIAKEIMDVYFGTPEISSNPEPITP